MTETFIIAQGVHKKLSEKIQRRRGRTDSTGDDTNSLPTNTRGSANIGLMLVQRLQRWPELGQH